MRRRRECLHCQRRTTTYEIESFDLERLLDFAEMASGNIEQFRLLATNLNKHADLLAACLLPEKTGRPSVQEVDL